MAGGYTYYWSGRSDGYHAQGVAVVVSNKLSPMIIEVTAVNERFIRRRIRHSLGIVSLVFVYAPNEVSDLTVKEVFCATLESVVDQCRGRDTLLILGISMYRLELTGMAMRRVLVPWVWNCEPE